MEYDNELMGALSAAMQPATQAYMQEQAALDGRMMAEPDWVQARDPSLNRFVFNPNQTVGGLAAVESSPYSGGMGGEAMDSSYFEGGVPGGQYLGLNEAIQPTYYLGQRFGKPVQDTVTLSTLTSGNPHRVINKTTGEVIYEGATPQGVVGALDQLTQGGNQDEWEIQQALGDQWSTVAKQERMENVFTDKFLPMALAAVSGGTLGPVIGAKLGAGKLAAAAGTGLASGAGSTAGHLIGGKPLDEALKAGAITGLTAGAVSGLGSALSGKTALAGAGGSKIGSLAPDGLQGFTPFDPSSITMADLGLGGLGAAGSAAASAADPIMTVVGNKIGSGVGSGFGGAAGAVGGGLSNIGADLVDQASLGRLADSYNQQPDYGVETPGITVTSTPTAPVSAGGALGAATGAAGYEILPDGTIQFNQTPDQIDVYGKKNPTVPLGSIAGVAPELLQPVDVAQSVTQQPGAPEDPEIKVTGKKPINLLPNVPVDPVQDILQTEGKSLEQEQAEAAEKKGGLGIIGKIGAGLTVADLLGKLLGGGGGGGNNLGPGAAALGTRASLDPVFGAQLPAPRAGGIFSPSSLAPRDMSGIDFARYGYGPAQSFFENVPRNADEYRSALSAATAPRPVTPGAGSVPVPPILQQPFDPNLNTGAAPADAIRRLVPDATDAQITEYLATPEGAQFMQALRDAGVVTAAKGGKMAAKRGAPKSRDAYAVKGPGTGRSDEIPALLSDGEYVIDAETVAMLGDGSSEAGAKRLDDFRVSIRKHKGRNLAKGKFSANAKRPENYLSGGRV